MIVLIDRVNATCKKKDNAITFLHASFNSVRITTFRSAHSPIQVQFESIQDLEIELHSAKEKLELKSSILSSVLDEMQLQVEEIDKLKDEGKTLRIEFRDKFRIKEEEKEIF